jgi:lambda family phage portal protein
MGLWQNLLGRARYGKPQALVSSGRAYDAAKWDSREMASWTPPLTSGVDENLEARDAVVRRSRDLVRNHPIIAGATDRRAESVVGANIRLESQPAFDIMGQSPEWADEWSSSTERWFELWARDPRNLCDAEMQLQFGGMIEMAYRHWWNDGEAAAVIRMLPANGQRIGAAWETCVEIVDPDRISNPRGMADYQRMPNGRTLIGGVEYDANKAPVAAHVRVAHPAGYNAGPTDSFRWKRVPFYGTTGRPIFVHAFKRNRADQRRGISRFVSAIKRIKMFDRYDDAEIEAALLNSVMAAWIESPAPTDEVMEALAPDSSGTGNENLSVQEMMEYRMEHPVKVNGARVIHGLPGEKMDFKRAEHPSANYPEFQATGLRAIAASLGLSYAQVAQNWADINYSSGRVMLNEIWRGLMHDRWLFTQGFCTKIYLAWLEESVARGIVKIPGRKTDFYKWRNALSLCEWTGPGRGTVDPLKEAQAADFEINQGSSDIITMSNEQGKDWRQILRNQSRVAKYRESIGLAAYTPLKASAQAGGEDGASGESSGTEADRDGDGEPNEDQRKGAKRKEPA